MALLWWQGFPVWRTTTQPRLMPTRSGRIIDVQMLRECIPGGARNHL
jgi:hypothetical protein